MWGTLIKPSKEVNERGYIYIHVVAWGLVNEGMVVWTPTTACDTGLIPGQGSICNWCIGLLLSQHCEEFGYLLIWSSNSDLEN